jgi:hypothetical protein
MATTRGTYTELAKLLKEVGDLAAEAASEMDNETRWNPELRRMELVHTGGKAPANTTRYGGTKTTGALRRRTMDLTRFLAEMRRY